MNNLSPEIIAAIAVVAAIALFLRPRKKPKEKIFKCTRCAASSPHSNRTIEAWRNGKTKFFCNACHTKWLRSQPAPAASQHASRSGCLGILVFFVVVPTGMLIMWAYT